MKIRTLDELLALQPPERRYIVGPHLLSIAGSLFVYGQAETFKSWLVMDMAYCVAAGCSNWLGFPVTRAKILVVQAEVPEFMYRDRVLKYIGGLNGSKPTDTSNYLHFCNEVDIKLDNFYGIGSLEKEIKDKGYQLIVLDNLYRTVSASTKDDLAMRRFLDALAKFQSKYMTAFVIIHHPRKEERGEDVGHGFEEMSGVSELNRWADTIVKLSHISKQEGTLYIGFEKQRNAEVPLHDLRLKFNRQKVRFSFY